jgi:hypothetical protein
VDREGERTPTLRAFLIRSLMAMPIGPLIFAPKGRKTIVRCTDAPLLARAWGYRELFQVCTDVYWPGWYEQKPRSKKRELLDFDGKLHP